MKMKTCTLPNGEKVFCIDELTAVYIYHEIYDENVYLYGGIEVKDGDIIFDVGANIGIFPRFIATKASNLKIYTFEPVLPIFQVLEANLKDVDADIKNYNVGLGEKDENLEITYYPRNSGESAIIPFEWNTKIDLYVEKYKELVVEDLPIARIVPKFLRRRVVKAIFDKIYSGEQIPCEIRRLSSIIKENNIKRIDLMKLDAENYERQVLAGINEEDWDRIRQIAMEVHTHLKGEENLMVELEEFLESKGFKTYEGEESRETIMGVYMLYAKR